MNIRTKRYINNTESTVARKRILSRDVVSYPLAFHLLISQSSFFVSFYYFVSPLIFSFDGYLYASTVILIYLEHTYSATGLISFPLNKIRRFLFSKFYRLEISFFLLFSFHSTIDQSDRKSFSSPSRHTSHASPIREGCTVYSTVYFVRSSGTVLFSICSTRSMLFYSASSATRAHRTSFLLATSVSHLIPRGPNAFSVEWRAWKRFSSAAQ